MINQLMCIITLKGFTVSQEEEIKSYESTRK